MSSPSTTSGLTWAWGEGKFRCLKSNGLYSSIVPFFLHRPRGGQTFLPCVKGGGQKKLTTRDHRQMAPLPVKNDSSLLTRRLQLTI